MNTKLWIAINQNVNVVWHDFNFIDIKAQLNSQFRNDFFKPRINAIF